MGITWISRITNEAAKEKIRQHLTGDWKLHVVGCFNDFVIPPSSGVARGGQGESRECDLFVNGKNFCYYPPPPPTESDPVIETTENFCYSPPPPPPLNAVGSRRGDENVPGAPPPKKIMATPLPPRGGKTKLAQRWTLQSERALRLQQLRTGRSGGRSKCPSDRQRLREWLWLCSLTVRWFLLPTPK